MSKSMLISGAGVAGATLAHWLSRYGFEVTVVERAAGQRSSGNPVDVKGPAVAVAREMGIMPRLRAAARCRGRRCRVPLGRHSHQPRGQRRRCGRPLRQGRGAAVQPRHRRGRPPLGGTPAEVRAGPGIHPAHGHVRGGTAHRRAVRHRSRSDHLQHPRPGGIGAPDAGPRDRGVHLPARRGARLLPPRHGPAQAAGHRGFRRRRLARSRTARLGPRSRRSVLRLGEPGTTAAMVTGTRRSGRRCRILPVTIRRRLHARHGRRLHPGPAARGMVTQRRQRSPAGLRPV